VVARSFVLKVAGISCAVALGHWPTSASAQSAGAGAAGAPSSGGASSGGAGSGGVSSGGIGGAGMMSSGGMSGGPGGGQGGMTAMGGMSTGGGAGGTAGMSSTNLVTNGTFETSTAPWWGYASDTVDPPAAQTVAVADGQLCATITAGGKNVWDVIVGLSDVPLLPNQYYHISFSVSADADRTIKFKTGLGVAPYTDYFIKSIPITTTAQTLDYTYLNLRNDPTGQFQFQIGSAAGKVCLDNIVLEPVAKPVTPTYTTPAPSRRPFKDYKSFIKLGTAVDTPIFLSNPLHNAIVAGEFAMITPANSMKMNIIEPTQGVFDYTDTDALAAWAEQNGLEFRGHPLVWHTQTPAWLTDGTFDRQQMIDIMFAHIDGLMKHYPGKFPYWDVVNEAIDEGTGTWRSTVWHDRIGDDFIDLAFTHARAADANAKLLYNDYNIEQKGNPKADIVFDMVSSMKTRGIPIDAIGLQSHYFVEPDGSTALGVPDMQAIRDNIARYDAIGVEVHITECDFRIGKPLDATKTDLQKKFFADLLQICIEAPNCSHFTVWGLSDLDSWVPSTFPEYDYAHIFDKDLMPKPAYFGMSDVLAKYNTDGTLVSGAGGMSGMAGMSGSGNSGSGNSGSGMAGSGNSGAAGAGSPSSPRGSAKDNAPDDGCSVTRGASGSAASLLATCAMLGIFLYRRRAAARPARTRD
jgi:GH35 family endo-1,4-beta-xylanase